MGNNFYEEDDCKAGHFLEWFRMLPFQGRTLAEYHFSSVFRGKKHLMNV